MPLMPLSQAFVRIFLETDISRLGPQLHPGRLAVQHHVGAFGWFRERCIDSRGEGVHQIRPAIIVDPHGTAALAAEVALDRAGFTVYNGLVDTQMFPALYLKGISAGAQIDGIAATPGGLATDRAIAEVEGIGLGGFHLKPHGLAGT